MLWRALGVSADEPHATGAVGVSAVDGRPYAADRRIRTGEPTGPGNEGPVAGATVTRHYRGAPTIQPAPGGTSGSADLWASVPEEFSGMSRFALRWPAFGGHRFAVLHATLDAVLDADQADRGAGRGAYAGMGPLGGTAVANWHALANSRRQAWPRRRGTANCHQACCSGIGEE